MLPTIIAALSALMLLCVPTSTLQSCGLNSIRWTPLKTNLLRVGAPAVTGLSPGAPPSTERGAAPGVQESICVEPGKPVERELSGGQSHSYKLAMVSGQYSRIVIEQRGIDVVVALLTPDGKKISEVDSNPVIEGSETVLTVAEVTGA